METGLENQCWKDSWNSILFADGSNSKLPRATAEIQGYVYDAKLRGARMARLFWNDAGLADRLEREAEDLKRRFNRDYWIEERGHFALAIDGDGRKVDSLTSNIGHLLWSGIVDQEHAAECLEKLLSDRLYSGWGIRTMAEGEGAYNPIGYHIGTVWPHDNSIIALGLARYGYRKEAARVAMGILEAATFFHDRLPEAFAGFRRDMTRFPVEYPTACSPQAWATGAPLLLLRVVLGLAAPLCGLAPWCSPQSGMPRRVGGTGCGETAPETTRADTTNRRLHVWHLRIPRGESDDRSHYLAAGRGSGPRLGAADHPSGRFPFRVCPPARALLPADVPPGLGGQLAGAPCQGLQPAGARRESYRRLRRRIWRKLSPRGRAIRRLDRAAGDVGSTSAWHLVPWLTWGCRPGR